MGPQRHLVDKKLAKHADTTDIRRGVMRILYLSVLAAFIASAPGLGVSKASAEVKEVRVIMSGGGSAESVEVGYGKPFTEKTGVKVTIESPTNLGKLRAMVGSGNITASLIELTGPLLEQARAFDLIEPLDWDAIDPDPIFDEARQPDALGFQYYSMILVQNKDAKPVTSWQDFWNVKDFPGTRSLPDRAVYTLQIALLADGVEPENLFPLDIDRAFESLEKIKDHISVWWSTPAQAAQLLNDGEVEYTVAFSGRVTSLENTTYSFNQGLLGLSYFTVPRGADPAEKAMAMKLLHEMTVAKNQAVAAEIISYTGASTELEALLPQDRLGEYPTTSANKLVQSLADDKWFFENAELVERRWQEFKLGL